MKKVEKKVDKKKRVKNQKYILYTLNNTFMNKKEAKILSFREKVNKIVRKLIKKDKFVRKYIKESTWFTRNRKLTIEIMILLILQKWVKSTQLKLNEFFSKLWKKISDIATSAAFSIARKKLWFELYIELNKLSILDLFYDKNENENWYKTWEWFRLLAVDWSKLFLPNSKEIKEKYWEIRVKNQYWEQKSYTWWLLSVLYDPLNNIALDSILEKWKYSERALAIKHILSLEKQYKVEEKNLIIFDRWYYSKYMFQILLTYWNDFLCRIKATSCKKAKILFDKNYTKNSLTIELKINKKDIENYKNKYQIQIKKEIWETIKVRFIRVVLDNWEIEVLATSLLNEDKYPDTVFKDLYFKRWWIELYYNVLKNRLSLENFTWKSVESVNQDLFSSIFVSNYETVMTIKTNIELEKRHIERWTVNKQKVNKQVSFNTIKNRVIELLFSNKPLDKMFEEIDQLFLLNPTIIRPWRKAERTNTSPRQSFNYHKRAKKHNF